MVMVVMVFVCERCGGWLAMALALVLALVLCALCALCACVCVLCCVWGFGRGGGAWLDSHVVPSSPDRARAVKVAHDESFSPLPGSPT